MCIVCYILEYCIQVGSKPLISQWKIFNIQKILAMGNISHKRKERPKKRYSMPHKRSKQEKKQRPSRYKEVVITII